MADSLNQIIRRHDIRFIATVAVLCTPYLLLLPQITIPNWASLGIWLFIVSIAFLAWWAYDVMSRGQDRLSSLADSGWLNRLLTFYQWLGLLLAFELALTIAVLVSLYGSHWLDIPRALVRALSAIVGALIPSVGGMEEAMIRHGFAGRAAQARDALAVAFAFQVALAGAWSLTARRHWQPILTTALERRRVWKPRKWSMWLAVAGLIALACPFGSRPWCQG